MVRSNPYKEPKRIKIGRFRYAVGKDNKPVKKEDAQESIELLGENKRKE